MKEGKWITINGRHIFLKEGQSPMDAFIKQKGGSNNYETLEKLSESKALTSNYSTSTDITRDMALNFYKELGYDKSPIVVDENKYNEMLNSNYKEIARGIRGYGVEGKNGEDFLNQYKQGEMYIGSQRVFGSGTYYTYENETKDTVSRYSNAEGKTYTALIDKNAKIITNNKLNELKSEYTNKMLQTAIKMRETNPEEASRYYEKMNRIINQDNGIFASALGYDAIDVDDAKYIVSMNRGKIIIKK